MVFSIFTDVFVNKAGNLVLHVKKTDQYYIIDDKNKNSIALFQNLMFNSISIAAIVGWFGKLNYLLWVAIAFMVYFGYTLYFNKKVLPQLQIIAGRSTQRRKEAEISKGKVIFVILASFGISIGLIVSLLYESLKSTVDDGIVILGIFLANYLGIKYLVYYIKKR